MGLPHDRFRGPEEQGRLQRGLSFKTEKPEGDAVPGEGEVELRQGRPRCDHLYREATRGVRPERPAVREREEYLGAVAPDQWDLRARGLGGSWLPYLLRDLQADPDQDEQGVHGVRAEGVMPSALHHDIAFLRVTKLHTSKEQIPNTTHLIPIQQVRPTVCYSLTVASLPARDSGDFTDDIPHCTREPIYNILCFPSMATLLPPGRSGVNSGT